MRGSFELEGASLQTVVERVCTPSHWDRWVPGLRRVAGEPSEMTLGFGGPRPFDVVVQVDVADDGVSFRRIAGDAVEFDGAVKVEADVVHVDLHVRFGPTLPGMLQSTFDRDALSALGSALTRVD